MTMELRQRQIFQDVHSEKNIKFTNLAIIQCRLFQVQLLKIMVGFYSLLILYSRFTYRIMVGFFPLLLLSWILFLAGQRKEGLAEGKNDDISF